MFIQKKRLHPDEALSVVVDSLDPRVVTEVELSNRNSLPLADHVHKLTKGWPLLRCVVGIKIYKRPSVEEAFFCGLLCVEKEG